MLINNKRLLYQKQYGSGIGSIFKNIANSQLFQTTAKQIKDGALSMYNNIIKPRFELLKNRAIEYGKDLIDVNRKELIDVIGNKKSMKDLLGTNKRILNQRSQDLIKTLMTGSGLKILK